MRALLDLVARPLDEAPGSAELQTVIHSIETAWGLAFDVAKDGDVTDLGARLA